MVTNKKLEEPELKESLGSREDAGVVGLIPGVELSSGTIGREPRDGRRPSETRKKRRLAGISGCSRNADTCRPSPKFPCPPLAYFALLYSSQSRRIEGTSRPLSSRDDGFVFRLLKSPGLSVNFKRPFIVPPFSPDKFYPSTEFS